MLPSAKLHHPECQRPAQLAKARLKLGLRVARAVLPAKEVAKESKRPVGLEQNPLEGLWSVVSGGTNAFASQLLTHFGGWQQSMSSAPFALKVLEAAVSKEKELAASKILADLSPFLLPVGVWESKHIRRQVALCALTYKMHLVTVDGMKRRFGLHLVTTSQDCKITSFEHIKSPEEVVADGDGMSASLMDRLPLLTSSPQPAATPSITPLSAVQPSLPHPPLVPHQWGAEKQPQEVVAEQLAEAWAAASKAAATSLALAADSFASMTSSLQQRQQEEAGLVLPHVTRFSEDLVAGDEEMQTVISSIEAAEALSTALPPGYDPFHKFEQASSAEDRINDAVLLSDGMSVPLSPSSAASFALVDRPASWPLERQGGDWQAEQKTTSVVLKQSPGSAQCPSEWFVCDEPSTDTRYFVVQGSDSIDHWKMNFAFDPVLFENPSLGVKVHRGVYEGAEVLYQRFLPLVLEHLQTSPFAKICFTGHSIGGSLATLLVLMYKMRGVLQEHNIANVYTFGTPAVFLEGGWCVRRPVVRAVVEPSPSSRLGQMPGRGSNQKSAASVHAPACACKVCLEGPRGLLASVGLLDLHVRNVMLAYDFVPRSTTCDYTPVADILQGLGPGFQEHCSLNLDGRKHLYSHIGRMIVVQPDRDLTFVGTDTPHPMLPAKTGLWIISSAGQTSVSTSTSTTNPLVTPNTVDGAKEAASSSTSCSMSEEQRSLPSSTPMQPSVGLLASAAIENQPFGLPSVTVKQPRGLEIWGLQNTQLEVEAFQTPFQLVHPRDKTKMEQDMPQPAGQFVPATVTEAMFEFMDNPHPLETLADAATSVGPWGSISRYHNPENYTKAMGRAIFHMRKEEKGPSPGWVVNQQLPHSSSVRDPEATSELVVNFQPAWDSSEADTSAACLCPQDEFSDAHLP